METFTEAKPFVENPRYFQDRRDTLAALDASSIDNPIVDIIDGFSQLTQGFTQQSCYGHFLSAQGQDPHSLNPIPSQETGWIRLQNRLSRVLHRQQPTRKGSL